MPPAQKALTAQEKITGLIMLTIGAIILGSCTSMPSKSTDSGVCSKSRWNSFSEAQQANYTGYSDFYWKCESNPAGN